MPVFVEVSVNVPQVTSLFHYHLPPELEGRVSPGHLVEVPFGKQQVHGVVLRQVDEPHVAETRAVSGLVDRQVVLTIAQLKLAHYLSENTLAPLSACINLMLPPGLAQLSDTLYQLNETDTPGGAEEIRGDDEASRGNFPHKTDEQDLSPLQKELVALLRRRGPLRGRQIEQVFRRRNWRAAANVLVRRNLLISHSVLPPPTVQMKAVRTARLAVPPDVAIARVSEMGRAGTKAFQRRQAVIDCLKDTTDPMLVDWVYAESSANASDLRVLAEHNLIQLGESEVWRDPLETIDFIPTSPPTLTQDQQEAWSVIRKSIHQTLAGQPSIPFLLHGVTGSGKTEIYLHAVTEVLQAGKQAIVLVPEIALTPQTVRRFLARFPGQVGLMHSGLSPGERYDTWLRARMGYLSVVVGPRSALFAPFPDLGLIVVDESHDESYYQDTNLPYYHASEAAVAYAGIVSALCLQGSATPDLVHYYQAKRKKWQYLQLPARILAHDQAVKSQIERLSALKKVSFAYQPLEQQAQSLELPPVQVIDMRAELKAGNRSIFSQSLQVELANMLEREEQAILFLNRRGTATYVFCRDCGLSLKCPRCDIPLVLHRTAPGSKSRQTTAGLICHHCNYQRALPHICPRCHSNRIRQYGSGTEKVESEVQSLFPKARILRWDYETTRQKGAHDAILSQFSARRADILIGTQMLAKGLDLPLVTLVGVILADVGLNMPDFRSAERTFQVLTQVAGRAGRSPLGGKVILQTFEPDHYVIQNASQHDYEGFFQQELDYRRHLGYPPFTKLVRLEFRHHNFGQAEAASRDLSTQIHSWMRAEERRSTSVIGPAPCFFARINNLYRWQIILRGPDPVSLLRERQLSGWRIEVNPPSLL
jgi:primosomal protein N' (replication factor Y) (superfamily II helicase)